MAVDCHKTWVSAAPVLFMEVIAIFEQLYFQTVKQITYCHVTDQSKWKMQRRVIYDFFQILHNSTSDNDDRVNSLQLLGKS